MIRFKQHRLQEMSMSLGDVDVVLTKHFEDRMKERSSNFGMDKLKEMLAKIKGKLASIPAEGDFLFFSRKLQQGFVAAWDAFKSKLSLVTFLPSGKSNPKPGTEKVVVEELGREITIIYID